MLYANVLDEPIGIIGAGVAGLITAHVLLQDGFTDVTVISRDKSVGGVWARERVYPGLHINNVHGEYRFSALEMLPPQDSSKNGGRLSGLDLCNYMENFAVMFLKGKAKFIMNAEVLNIERLTHGAWSVEIEELDSKRTLSFSKIILASGGCSTPFIPQSLGQNAAETVGFRGIVAHSSNFAARFDDILETVNPTSKGNNTDVDFVLVVGGGKSAMDMSAKLASEGRKVVMVFEHIDAFLAAKSPLPEFIRKSRFLSVLSAWCRLNSRLERFLHNTSIGSWITHSIWKRIGESSFNAFDIPQGSPLRRSSPLFWTIRLNDEGKARPDSFYTLANLGVIDIIAPARLLGYTNDGKSVILSNGQTLSPKAVLLATGYQSSWSNIFKQEVAAELGIDQHPLESKISIGDKWDYRTLGGSAHSLRNPEQKPWVNSIYRGLIPAKNIKKRDFAIAGALFTANPGYTNEVSAHWIASYFRGDEMQLPSSTEEAIATSEERAVWMRVRYPEMSSWANESYRGSFDFWTWPQAADELLEDMYLPSMRSGGNWFSWIFKVIDLSEIKNLTKERQEKRKGTKV